MGGLCLGGGGDMRFGSVFGLDRGDALGKRLKHFDVAWTWPRADFWGSSGSTAVLRGRG